MEPIWAGQAGKPVLVARLSYTTLILGGWTAAALFWPDAPFGLALPARIAVLTLAVWVTHALAVLAVRLVKKVEQAAEAAPIPKSTSE